jgi:hypothetical protein
VSAPPAGLLAHVATDVTERGAPRTGGATVDLSTSAQSQESHSLRKFDFASRAVPADASNIVQMPDGAQLVGPTTFSLSKPFEFPAFINRKYQARIDQWEKTSDAGREPINLGHTPPVLRVAGAEWRDV